MSGELSYRAFLEAKCDFQSATGMCPLQFEIIDRLIEPYSNPSDLVFDPFLDIGSVPVRALKKGRRGAGVELSDTSFKDAAHYCRATEREVSVPDLFGLMKAEEQEAA